MRRTGLRMGADQGGVMGEIVSLSAWMGNIHDDVPVTALSIPGSHDSGSVDGPWGLAKTQNLDLAAQLIAGIRFLDIRLAHYQDDPFVYHDIIYNGKCYKDVLRICSGFLMRHPSETILMSVKEEGRVDSLLGDSAPSEVVGRLFRGEGGCWDNTRSFDDEFECQTWEHVGHASLFYNAAAYSPGSRSGIVSPAFTCETTLGDVRGMLVLLRRFGGGEGIGFDMTYWLDDACTRSSEDKDGNARSTGLPIYSIEDHHDDPDGK